MTRAISARQPLTLSAVATQVLCQFATTCFLLGRVMSWAFGLKTRTSAEDKKKIQDDSEKEVEKLQGYHDLAKV